jgi:ergothioneine biosynthesis protein EgtB
MSLARPISGFTADQFIDKLAHARDQLHTLIDCLPADGWLGPRAEHLNPPLWEVGHIVWFQERWCLRHQPDGSCAPSLLPGADELYNSSTVPHESRWDLPLLAPAALDQYAASVFAAMTNRLRNGFDDELAYFAELSLVHELMHVEAWWMAFQNLGYVPPFSPALPGNLPTQTRQLSFAAGEITLGSDADEGFIFDNEKWRHTTALAAFDIDACPVSEVTFAAFVDAGGYQQPTLWSASGWAWREASAVSHPLYWRRQDGGWQVRRFAEWMPLDPAMSMLHVNRHEAEACAAWLGRRLPSAGEWLRAVQEPGFRSGMNWEWMRDPFAGFRTARSLQT